MKKLGDRGGISTAATVWLVLGIIAIVIFAVFLFRPKPVEIITPTPIITEEGVVTPIGLVSCPSDSTTDGQLRYLDDLASTITQVEGNTCYFMPKTVGQERITAGATSADLDVYSTAVNLPCTKAGTKWRLICVGQQGIAHSADEGVDFIAAGAFVRRDLHGKKYGDLQVRVEDNFAGGATFFNMTSGGGTNSTAYMNIDNGASGVTVADAAGGSSLKVDTDEYIDAIIYLKTNATKRQFGEDELNTWALVDADGGSWEEPLIGWDGAATLLDQGMGVMAEDDQRKYSGIEYVYNVGIVGDRQIKLTYFHETASGVDPGASADPIIEFCTESRYNSVKLTQTINIGCWTDAATQAQVSSANRQKLTFDVTA